MGSFRCRFISLDAFIDPEMGAAAGGVTFRARLFLETGEVDAKGLEETMGKERQRR